LSCFFFFSRVSHALEPNANVVGSEVDLKPPIIPDRSGQTNTNQNIIEFTILKHKFDRNKSEPRWKFLCETKCVLINISHLFYFLIISGEENWANYNEIENSFELKRYAALHPSADFTNIPPVKKSTKANSSTNKNESKKKSKEKNESNDESSNDDKVLYFPYSTSIYSVGEQSQRREIQRLQRKVAQRYRRRTSLKILMN
jgi:hypothetical protein